MCNGFSCELNGVLYKVPGTVLLFVIKYSCFLHDVKQAAHDSFVSGFSNSISWEAQNEEESN